ncbi:hypothetical protein TNCT_269781 [Trichonephila clavata]|uniref:Uncharacterized protein n=1 Tax=Trichonephila clavata TaxID=2740835 RepID=A0A8X6HBD0_TRICU|nr:hypothetical protein TNCT_269781 [Trichonephila clavata]
MKAMISLICLVALCCASAMANNMGVLPYGAYGAYGAYRGYYGLPYAPGVAPYAAPALSAAPVAAAALPAAPAVAAAPAVPGAASVATSIFHIQELGVLCINYFVDDFDLSDVS